jgi:hypothetical protein
MSPRNCFPPPPPPSPPTKPKQRRISVPKQDQRGDKVGKGTRYIIFVRHGQYGGSNSCVYLCVCVCVCVCVLCVCVSLCLYVHVCIPSSPSPLAFHLSFSAAVHGKNDTERVLTPLGQEQAAATGKRLREILGTLSAVCCLLSAVCCLLSAVCCLLSAVCCLLSAVCCLLSAVCCLLSSVCGILACLLLTVCCLLPARHVWYTRTNDTHK